MGVHVRYILFSRFIFLCHEDNAFVDFELKEDFFFVIPSFSLSRRIKMSFPNPHFPTFRFTMGEPRNHVDFCLLYTQNYAEGLPRTHDNYQGDMDPKDIDELCSAIKEELELNVLGWGYFCGRCVVCCAKEDAEKDKIYDIVNAFLARGRRIYMNDGSEVTFNPGDHASVVGQQEKIKKSMEGHIAAGGLRLQSVMRVITMPVASDDFWIIPGGKELAAQIRSLKEQWCAQPECHVFP